MKKFAAALAAVFAAGTASAASVTVYGMIDTGFSLSRTSGDAAKAGDGSWNFQMKSGQRNGSRFGFRGVEELSSSWKVGFILEDQFKGDDGTLQDSSFWARESTVFLDGRYGRFTFGKVGQLKSPVGSTALAGTRMYPFGTLMSNFIGGLKYITAGTYLTVNNSVTYRSPDFGGFKVHAQYSLAMNGQEGTGMNDDDRYMALALDYRKGPANAMIILDHIDLDTDEAKSYRDPWTVTAAANYDFGPVKPYIYTQYFRNSALNAVGADYRSAGNNISASGRYTGFGVLAAVQWPMLGGKSKIGGGYTKANGRDSTDNDVRRYSAHIGYDYPLSRRTDLYADLGWVRQDTKRSGLRENQNGTELSFGMVHRF